MGSATPLALHTLTYLPDGDVVVVGRMQTGSSAELPPDGAELEANDWREVAGSEADWQKDRRTLLDISTQFLTRAQALDDAGLSRHVVWYKGGGSQPLAMRIIRTTTHDIYHSGQIRYLRALQRARSG